MRFYSNIPFLLYRLFVAAGLPASFDRLSAVFLILPFDVLQSLRPYWNSCSATLASSAVFQYSSAIHTSALTYRSVQAISIHLPDPHHEHDTRPKPSRLTIFTILQGRLILTERFCRRQYPEHWNGERHPMIRIVSSVFSHLPGMRICRSGGNIS